MLRARREASTRKSDVTVWTGYILRKGPSGWLLWTRHWNMGCHKGLEISLSADGPNTCLLFCSLPFVTVIFISKQKHYILHNLYQLPLFICTWKSRMYFNNAFFSLFAYHSDICKLFYVMDSFMCYELNSPSLNSRLNPLNMRNQFYVLN